MRLAKHLIVIFLIPLTTTVYSQRKPLGELIFGQDSSVVKNQKSWLNLSLGHAITIQTDRLDVFVISTSLAFTNINKNYRLIKVKTLFNHGFTLFDNFGQKAGELNFMTGKIKAVSNRSKEFYYGIGVMIGSKRSGVISYPNSAGYFPYTNYARKDFISIGIPFEYKLQWKVFGVGLDGNQIPIYHTWAGKCSLELDRYRR